MDSASFSDLVAGYDEKYLADFLGVTLPTFRNWKRGRVRVPKAVERLLRLKLTGDLSALAGNDWEGFYFGRDGKFYHPFWLRGFTSWQLKAMFFTTQDAWQLRADLLEAQEKLKNAQLGQEDPRAVTGLRRFKFELVD